MHTSPGLRHALVRVAPFVGIAISLVVVWWIVMGPIMGSDPWTGFRLYFANDQLSYARIATNVANGGPWFSEPFTHTGTSYYPSLWYFIIGLFSAATGLSVPTGWTLLGVALVSVTIALFAITAWKLSGRWWATITPALAITAGTLQSVSQGHHEGRRRHEEGDVAQPDPLTAPVNRVILSRCQKNRREPI